MSQRETRLYSALLKFWRERRGLTQLDLAFSSEVSSRHISFLETGRAKPSRDMVLRLASVLEVPLRDRNLMLQAADFAPAFQEPSFERELAPEIAQLFERMLSQHEPFPMVVVNRAFDVLRCNISAVDLLMRFIAEPSALGQPWNVIDMVLDPRLARPFIVEWNTVARFMLSRVNRELLERPHDSALAACAHRARSYPDVPEAWSTVDLSEQSSPALVARLKRDELDLRFLTTITLLNAPQNIMLEELRIDSYYPLDEATAVACRRIAAQRTAREPPSEVRDRTE